MLSRLFSNFHWFYFWLCVFHVLHYQIFIIFPKLLVIWLVIEFFIFFFNSLFSSFNSFISASFSNFSFTSFFNFSFISFSNFYFISFSNFYFSSLSFSFSFLIFFSSFFILFFFFELINKCFYITNHIIIFCITCINSNKFTTKFYSKAFCLFSSKVWSLFVWPFSSISTAKKYSLK